LLIRNQSGAQIGSASGALANDTWHCVEYDWSTSGSDTRASLRVNGTDIATGTYTTPGTFSLDGFQIFGIGAGLTHYFDDLSIDDAEWCGEGKVVLLKPVSDHNLGSWKSYSGGWYATPANLYLFLNYTPPPGWDYVTGSDDTTGNNSTDEYRANLTTYTNAGIGSGDTVKAIFPWILHGEEVKTGTKAGTFQLYSNPSNNTVSLDFNDSANLAVGTYPTGWKWTPTAVVNSPSVTLGSSPVAALRKTDTGTRYAVVGGMYAYVEYRVASGPQVYTETFTSSLAATDAYSAPSNYTDTLSDSAVPADSVSATAVLPVSLSDSAAAADTMAATAVLPGAINESAVMVDNLTGLLVLADSLSASALAETLLDGTLLRYGPLLSAATAINATANSATPQVTLEF
jgi:hypothetical protein